MSLVRKRSTRRLMDNSPSASPENQQDLREELTQLRDSTKSALMESWAEVEHLQIEKAEFEERTHALQQELVKSRERETKWQNLLTELQRQHRKKVVVQNNQNKLPTIKQPTEQGGVATQRRSLLGLLTHRGSCSNLNKRSDNQPNTIGLPEREQPPLEQQRVSSLRRTRSAVLEENPPPPPRDLSSSPNAKWNLLVPIRRGSLNAPSYHQPKKVEDELRGKMKRMEEEKSDMIEQWTVKLECRESAIKEMERVTDDQGSLIEQLRRELRATKAKAAAKEATLLKQLEQSKKKLQEKKRTIAKQQSRIEKYKVRVDELSDELFLSNHTNNQSSSAISTSGGSSIYDDDDEDYFDKRY